MSRDLSLITPSKNNLKNLHELHIHLRSFKELNFEWIIMDSSSEDGTVEYFNGIVDQGIRFVSFPDNGIYEAINNGIKLSQSSYYLICGGDDRPNLSNIFSILNYNLHSGYTLILGSVNYAGNKIKRPAINYVLPYKSRMSFHSVGTIIKRNIHDSIGFYPEIFSLGSDEYIFLKILGERIDSILVCDINFGFYSNTGISSRSHYLATLEMFYIRSSFYKPSIRDFLKLFYNIFIK